MTGKKKITIAAVSAVICISAVVISVLSARGVLLTEKESKTHETVDPVGSVAVLDVFPYEGEFFEDGSMRKAENVFAVRVRNTESRDIRLTRLFITVDGRDYLFEITTLPVGKEAVVLEKKASGFPEGLTKEGFDRAREENTVYFEKPLALHKDTLEITPHEGVFNIKNISAKDIGGNIYVYYKLKNKDGCYAGGITFRTRAGGLKAGELKQIPAGRFREGSEIMFIDYETE